MRLMGMEYINGLMEKYIRESGKTIKWMDKAFWSGLMIRNIKVDLKMIKDMAMEYINGKMERSSEVTGLKAGKMVLAF
jgi:hypothetical protein